MAPRSRISESFDPFLDEGTQDVLDTAAWRDWGLGVDVHSRFIQVCVMIPDYTRQKVRRIERQFRSSVDRLVEAREWARSVLLANGLKAEPWAYALESTGCYHIPVVHAWQGTVHLINPLLASESRRKTDVLDARRIAYHHLTGLWPASWFPDVGLLELRVLARARRNAKAAAHRRLLSIGSALLTFGYTFTSAGSLAKKEQRALIEDLIEARLTAEEAKPHLPVGLSLPDSSRRFIREAYEAWDSGQQEAARLQKEIGKGLAVRSWPIDSREVPGAELIDKLCGVPGVGPVTASLWLLEIGDVRRFPNAKSVAAYCGFDPSVKVSAGKTTAHVRRKGNARLHHGFIQAAQSVLRRATDPFGRWGQALARRSKKGGWQRAVGAVARRLAQSCYYVHVKGEDFRYPKQQRGGNKNGDQTRDGGRARKDGDQRRDGAGGETRGE